MKRPVLVLTLLLLIARDAVAENPVYIPDPHLKAAIEARLGKTNPTPTDMLALTSLSANGQAIVDLTGLETATNLTNLDLRSNQISNVNPLAGLSKLTWLGLRGNQISSLSPLAGLTHLTSLEISENQIGDVSPLAGLTNLTELYLMYNQISDISPLLTLRNLGSLDLYGCPLNEQAYCSDLTTIKNNNPKLTWIGYSGNQRAPSGVAASQGTYTGYVRITWNAVCSGLYGNVYTVWRSDTPDGTKTKLTPDVTTTQFQDSTPTTGTVYYYAVSANGETAGETVMGWRGQLKPSDLCDGGEQSRSFAPTIVAAGQQFRIETSVSNSGQGSSWPFRVDFYASLDTSITTSDYLIGQTSFSKVIPVGGVSTVQWSGAFSAGIPGGTYYVGWMIDAANQVQETNEKNNTAWNEGYRLIVHGAALPALSVSPASGAAYTGKAGGPFTPAQTTYTLTNSGDAPVTWQASKTQTWITLSATSGTLAAQSTANVNVMGNAQANGLAAGTYTDTITFTNQTNGAGTTTRGVTLTVQAAGGGGTNPPGVIYVDDDAPSDPGPNNPKVSDPAENGSREHPYDSVQKGINAAAKGNTIVVLPGVYVETIDLGGKAITVTSLAGFEPNSPDAIGAIDNTIFDGGGKGPVVSFLHAEDPNCVLYGFTIVGGSARGGGGVECDGSAPTISHCLIAGNRATHYGGGAVDCYRSRATFRNCTICGNTAVEAGGAASCEQSNDSFVDCIIWANTPDAVSVVSGNPPSIRYCDVQGGWTGTGNLAADPCFAASGYWADPAHPDVAVPPATADAVWVQGDYHLRSVGGRYDPANKTWVTDAVSSVCIDAGDPNAGCLWEPLPNGGRINLGVYGGTAEASKTKILSGCEALAVALTSGVPVTSLASARDGELFYKLQVPAGASQLTIKISGGTGDADLYVRYGSCPTLSNYDYAPGLAGNEETIPINAPAAGTWFIMVQAVRTFTDVTLETKISGIAGTP